MNDDLTVFISYRRADSSADAGRLYDALRRRFGRENLFMDVDSLRPGEDWVVAVEAAVTGCDVLLAVIGPTWADAADRDGQVRLYNELDRVRLEIEAALRNNKPVIPVLVEGATMPSADQLPDSLKPLLRRHAIRISHPTFESDLGALVRALRTIERSRRPKAEPKAAPATTSASEATVAPAAVPVPPPPEPLAESATQTYVAPAPPAPFSSPVYPAAPVQAAAPVQPAYPYQAPAYAYTQPAARTGPSPLVLALLGLGGVAVVGFLLLALLRIGPFAATAVSTSTPTPTSAPPTDTPPPPTVTLPPPTQTPTSPPTPSPSPSPSSPPLTFDFVMSWISLSGANRDSCVDVEPDATSYWPADAAVVVECGPLPITDSTVQFYRHFALYPDNVALNAAYATYVSTANATTGTGSCPSEIPSEQSWFYSNPETGEMGRELCFVQDTFPYLIFTANHANLFGALLGANDVIQPTVSQLADAFAQSAGVKRP
jgi:TIR domain